MENEYNPESSPTNETTQIHEHAPLTPLASPSYSSSPKPSVSSPWDITYDQPTSPYRWFASLAKRCGRVYSLAVSDSSLVYLGSDSKYIRVWKLPGFGEYGRLRSGSSVVKTLLVSSEDGLLFSAHSDNKIRVWETRPAHRRKGTLPSLKDRFTETCLHRPKSFLVGSSSSSNQSRYDKLAHSGEITSLAYNAMGKFLYSASMDKTVKVWSIGAMKCVETIRAHDDHVNAIALGPDGLLFTGSDDMTVKIWRRSLGGDRSHGLVLNLHVQNSPVKALTLGQEGETEETYLLYAGCSDGYVHYWRKGELSGHMSYCGYLRGHSHAVLCLSSVEKLVVSGSADTSIRVWSRSSEGMAAHTCIATLSGHIGPVKGVVANLSDDDGCLVYSGSLDGSVKLWWVWREGGGGDGGGGEGIVGDQRGSSWADYFEISRSFRRTYC